MSSLPIILAGCVVWFLYHLFKSDDAHAADIECRNRSIFNKWGSYENSVKHSSHPAESAEGAGFVLFNEMMD